MRQLSYRGYVGSIEVSLEDDTLFGKLLHIRDLVSYEAKTPGELEAEFRSAVDDYLADCLDDGVEPDKPFKGQFNVRLTAELHRDLAEVAYQEGTSLNDYVQRVLSCHKHVESDGTLKHTISDVKIVIQTDQIGSKFSTHRSDVDTFLIQPVARRRDESKVSDRKFLPMQIGQKPKRSLVQ